MTESPSHTPLSTDDIAKLKVARHEADERCGRFVREMLERYGQQGTDRNGVTYRAIVIPGIDRGLGESTYYIGMRTDTDKLFHMHRSGEHHHLPDDIALSIYGSASPDSTFSNLRIMVSRGKAAFIQDELKSEVLAFSRENNKRLCGVLDDVLSFQPAPPKFAERQPNPLSDIAYLRNNGRNHYVGKYVGTDYTKGEDSVYLLDAGSAIYPYGVIDQLIKETEQAVSKANH